MGQTKEPVFPSKIRQFESPAKTATNTPSSSRACAPTPLVSPPPPSPSLHPPCSSTPSSTANHVSSANPQRAAYSPPSLVSSPSCNQGTNGSSQPENYSEMSTMGAVLVALLDPLSAHFLIFKRSRFFATGGSPLDIIMTASMAELQLSHTSPSRRKEEKKLFPGLVSPRIGLYDRIVEFVDSR